jgi:multicomponent Na+:H+ antiporter subunit A
VIATIAPLQATALVLAALGATAVALCPSLLRQVVLSGVYGFVLAILFVTFQAPDVALSMLVVATVAAPLIVLAAIARSRQRIRRKDE